MTNFIYHNDTTYYSKKYVDKLKKENKELIEIIKKCEKELRLVYSEDHKEFYPHEIGIKKVLNAYKEEG